MAEPQTESAADPSGVPVDPHSRKGRAVLVGLVAVIGSEIGALLVGAGLLLAEIVQGASESVGFSVGLAIAAVGAAIAMIAALIGVRNGFRGGRAPLVTWQLLQIVVCANLLIAESAGLGVGFAIAGIVVGILATALLLHPATTARLNPVGPPE